jgi:hypothetical protein
MTQLDIYSTRQKSGTAGNVSIAVLAASLMVTPYSHLSATKSPIARLAEKPSTVGQIGNLLATTPLEMPVQDFEASVSAFYAALLGKQEILGSEFEQILHDNLWDLYERS